MGKGDSRSKRGKLWIGTFGVSRPKPSKKRAAKAARTAKPGRKSK